VRRRERGPPGRLRPPCDRRVPRQRARAGGPDGARRGRRPRRQPGCGLAGPGGRGRSGRRVRMADDSRWPRGGRRVPPERGRCGRGARPGLCPRQGRDARFRLGGRGGLLPGDGRRPGPPVGRARHGRCDAHPRARDPLRRTWPRGGRRRPGRPAVGAAADGSFVAAWESAGQDGDGRGIFAQRFDATGAPPGASGSRGGGSGSVPGPALGLKPSRTCTRRSRRAARCTARTR
jgi:hypothetical protein